MTKFPSYPSRISITMNSATSSSRRYYSHSIHCSSVTRSYPNDGNPIEYISTKQKAAIIFKDFTNRTTLLGVSHYLQTKNILWLIAYLCLIATSIAQSWNSANDFFNNKGTQNYLITSRAKLPFPSVTVCSYALIKKKFDFSKIKNYYIDVKNIDKCDQKDSSDDENLDAIRLTNNKLLMMYLRNLTNSQRTNLSINFRSMIKECTFREQNCSLHDQSKFFFFNNPYYGNCFTFNPAFNDSEGLEVDLRTKLSMTFKMNTSEYVKIDDDRMKIGLLLHIPGTAPVLESSSVADLYPGQSVEFILRLSVKTFERGLSTKCIDRDSYQHQTASKFYFNSTPYLYAVDACMKSCEQERIINGCNKIDAIMPVQDDESMINGVLMPPSFTECEHINMDGLDMENCGCRLPCNYIQYTINSDTTAFAEECAKPIQNAPLKKLDRIKFSINFLTSVVEEVIEVPEYSLAQFLGILGGNLSLWIGLCVVSLLEILELLWKLLRMLIRNRNWSRFKSVRARRRKKISTKSLLNIKLPTYTSITNLLRFHKK